MTIRGKSKASKGYSKASKRRARRDRISKYSGPFTVKEILQKSAPIDKHDVDTRSFSVRTIPTDPDSVTTTRRFRVLDQPKRPLEVLQTKRLAEQGIKGNNLTAGPPRYAFWRSLLDGAALASFDKHSRDVGNETNDNLVEVVKRWLTSMLPQRVLMSHQLYLRRELVKSKEVTTQQFATAVETLNNINEELPPGFDPDQKIKGEELRELIAERLPREQRRILRSNGIDPRSSTIEQMVETAQRVETMYELESSESSDESSEDEKPKKSAKKKGSTKRAPSKKEAKPEFYCKIHGKNSTHDSSNCYKLKRDRDGHGDKKPSANAYKKAKRDLHLVEEKLAEEKRKRKEANKRLEREQYKFNKFMKQATMRRIEAEEARREALRRADSDSDSDIVYSDNEEEAKGEAPKLKSPRKSPVLQDTSDEDSDSNDGSDSD